MKIGFSLKYLCAFIAVFIVEAVIAVFIHDNFIRPHIGDVLVTCRFYLQC